MLAVPAHLRVSFGLFEADLHTGELWRSGRRIKLQTQPFKVLSALLERPGQIVTRKELQLRLWGRETTVDFDHSLGTAVNKVREALGDSADNPRFIETLSRRGYRFVAPVHVLDDKQPESAVSMEPAGSPTQPVEADAAASRAPAAFTVPASEPLNGFLELASQASLPQNARRIRPGWLSAAIATALVLTLFGFLLGRRQSVLAPAHIEQLTEDGHLALGLVHMESLAAGVTDGVHLFASTIEGGSSRLVSIDLNGGAISPIPIPAEVAAPSLGDLSGDGSKLLLRSHLSPESEQPLWIVPTTGGSALRIGSVLAHDATWMPDGEGILAASGKALYLIQNNDAPQLYVNLPGEAFWLRWNPSGTLLRFTIIDPVTHTEALWQLRAGDRTPTRLLAGWNTPASECCGIWTANGKHFVFESSRGFRSNIWELHGDRTSGANAITDGPLHFGAPVPARSGSRIFFLGGHSRSELQQYDPITKQMVSKRDFLVSAVRVTYSRDAQWVAWTDGSGVLWRARSDGTQKLQLTPAKMDVFLSQWSPNGSQLALMARVAGQAWTIFRVPAAGGPVDRLLKDVHNAADPSWAPDGIRLLFGRTNDVFGADSPSRSLLILNTATGAVVPVPGSEGLFSPRWSPDGRYIAALTLNQRELRLYDLRTATWSSLPATSAADPVWSADSQYIYFHGSLDPGQPIARIEIATRRAEEVVRLNTAERAYAVDFVFGGLTPENQPLVRARSVTGDYYSLDLH